MPRPKLPEDKSRTKKMLRVRLRPGEMEYLKKVSDGKMSEYVRKKIFPKGLTN